MQALETKSLRGQTLSGLFWLISQSLLSKVFGILGQLCLAYLLVPKHFEVISLAYTVTAFARILELGGIREVLVYRWNEFANLKSSAFFLSLTLGFISALVIVISAPIAAAIYEQPDVRNLLLGLAVTPILATLSNIPTAKLQNERRFAALASITALQTITQNAVAVLFAWLQFGAWSFVISAVISNLLSALALWHVAKPEIVWRWTTQLWQTLWNDTFTLSLVSLLSTVSQQIDYMMLGIYQKASVGYYFFAFTLATQTAQILGANLSTVFLPILSKMQKDAARQLQASLKAFQMLAAVGFPLAFLQTAIADPAFRFFLPEKWIPSIPYVQVLSLGLGVNLMSGLCWSVLKSQGRFNYILYLNLAGAIIFSFSAFLAARFGNALIMAGCVDGICVIYAPIILWLSISNLGGTWREVWKIFSTPLSLSSLALAVSWFADSTLFLSIGNQLCRLFLVASTFTFVYLSGLVIVKHPLSKLVFEWMKSRRISLSS